jgi:hypothetical protein
LENEKEEVVGRIKGKGIVQKQGKKIATLWTIWIAGAAVLAVEG